MILVTKTLLNCYSGKAQKLVKIRICFYGTTTAIIREPEVNELIGVSISFFLTLLKPQMMLKDSGRWSVDSSRKTLR